MRSLQLKGIKSCALTTLALPILSRFKTQSKQGTPALLMKPLEHSQVPFRIMHGHVPN